MGGCDDIWFLVVSLTVYFPSHFLMNCSLKNNGIDNFVGHMFDAGVEAMALPMKEKLQLEQGDGGMSFR